MGLFCCGSFLWETQLTFSKIQVLRYCVICSYLQISIATMDNLDHELDQLCNSAGMCKIEGDPREMKKIYEENLAKFETLLRALEVRQR